MKAKFKSEDHRQMFIDYGEDRWATSPLGQTNNNRRIAKAVGMEEFVVKRCTAPFNGWYDIIIDGKHYDSIASEEVHCFEFFE